MRNVEKGGRPQRSKEAGAVRRETAKAATQAWAQRVMKRLGGAEPSVLAEAFADLGEAL